MSSWSQRVIRHRKSQDGVAVGIYRSRLVGVKQHPCDLAGRYPAWSNSASAVSCEEGLVTLTTWSCSIQSESDDLGGPATATAMSRRHAEAGLRRMAPSSFLNNDGDGRGRFRLSTENIGSCSRLSVVKASDLMIRCIDRLGSLRPQRPSVDHCWGIPEPVPTWFLEAQQNWTHR